MELAGRGAGIVTHEPLLEALQAVGASTDELGIRVQERVAFDRQGRTIARLHFPQLVTSWDRIHAGLRALVPEGRYLLGRVLTGYEEGPDRIVAQFADGKTDEADLLIGADGFRSAARARMLPQTVPEYAGYVVWRALAPESALPEDIRETVFPHFGIFAPNDMQLIGYPIAGPGNDLRPGHRSYNVVWYCRVPSRDLRDMLTDAEDRRHDVSIPPPLVRDEIVARAMDRAARRLPPAFAKILRLGERPFFTPIYDHRSPIMASGRVALSGDAACGVRPHAGMGVTKAALDALALARHLAAAPMPQALRAYSAERTAASRRAWLRARTLGSYISDSDAERNRDGASHPFLGAIMRETAVMVA